MRGKREDILRRLGGLVMAAALVASQLLGALAPIAAYAASGSMTITSSTHGGEGFIAFGTADGHEAYCINPERGNPDDHTFTRWDWTGEASGILPDPHALAYLMSQVAPGNPQGFATPDSSINLAVWMLCGASVDFGGGAYSVADMSGNIYEGAGGRVSRSDAGKIQSVVADARAHAGQSGEWDRMSRVWYNDGAPCQSVVEVLPYGSISLGKSSADTSVSAAEGLYSLAGAEYGVFTDEGCTNKAATIKTDSKGNGSADQLAPGTYWVRETKAPKGYALDGKAHKVTVSAGRDSHVDAPEQPQSNPLGLAVAKVDTETGAAAQGDATLAGAEFRVEYYASAKAEGKPARTWVLRTGADGRATLDAEHLVSGDDLYHDSKGNPTVPLGTVVVTETKAPEGYLLTDTKPHTVSVTAEGTAEAVTTYVAPEVADDVIRGGMSLAKRDLELDGTVPQGDASLDATYTIYNRSAGPVTVGGKPYGRDEAVWSGTADPDDGSLATPADLLPYGTYEVRETEPATGYLPDEAWSFTFEVREDGKVYSPGEGQHNADQVIRGGLDVAKQDRETLRFRPLGGASLEGAELTVYNSSERAVLVGGELVQPGDACLTLTTDADGLAFVASDGLPYGTYVVRETKAPRGYLLNEEWSRTFEVREDGSVALLNTTEDAVDDQVIRGDLHLVKVRERGMDRLSGVPFLVTSETTGESHVVVTDANGQIDTASSWNPHSQRTNANDAAVSADGTVDEAALDPDAGVWFTGATDVTTDPIDSLGALPFDTYRVEELRVAANEGLELVTLTVTVTRHGTDVDGGTVDDSPGPHIETELTGRAGPHVTKGDHDMTLTDTVWYENLEPGREYTVNGTLMDKATGEPLLDADGNPATASTTFKAKTSSGTVEMEFTFKVNYVNHVSIVAFESLLEDGVEVAVHADIEDEDQTVHVPEIGTTASDSETGAHVALADDSVTITDTVAYQNLLPGQTYQLAGTLMDKSTGEPVTGPDGNAVSATTELTPESPDGEATVELSFDATQLAGHDVVVFERLYLGEAEVAEHADIEDAGQTVTLPKIGTTATAGGAHEAAASESLTITDVVSYEGLVPGEEHVVEGTLVDKATGEAIEGATASATFTPEEASGTVEVTFTIDASQLSGHGLVAFERVSWQGHVVATHEDLSDEGQTVRIPRIGTTATDASDGDHVAQASAKLRIADEVAYEGLTPGQEYVVTGTLMDKATGKAVDGATASATFTPKEESGTVTVTFELDGSKLAGHDLVAFEVLTRGEATVATHEDIEDEGQTVRVVSIGTTATDKADGDHTVAAAKAEVVDVVAYQGLTPGQEYVVTGTLMDRETGKPVTDGSGKPVTASTSFTPEKADGQVSVTFELDASQLGGHDLVAFEVLTQGEATVATHEDLKDGGQTVHVEEPKVPENPTTPRLLPKTGDDTRLGPFVAAMVASGSGLVALGVWELRRRRRDEGWDGDDPDDGYPHIRRGRVTQTMPDLGQGEGVIL